MKVDDAAESSSGGTLARSSHLCSLTCFNSHCSPHFRLVHFKPGQQGCAVHLRPAAAQIILTFCRQQNGQTVPFLLQLSQSHGLWAALGDLIGGAAKVMTKSTTIAVQKHVKRAILYGTVFDCECATT